MLFKEIRMRRIFFPFVNPVILFSFLLIISFLFHPFQFYLLHTSILNQQITEMVYLNILVVSLKIKTMCENKGGHLKKLDIVSLWKNLQKKEGRKRIRENARKSIYAILFVHSRSSFFLYFFSFLFSFF